MLRAGHIHRMMPLQFPATLGGVGFVSPSTGDYHLAASSPFRGVAGADMDQIVAAQGGTTAPPDSAPAAIAE